MAKTLIILGEYNPDWETHRATDAAIEHSSRLVGCAVEAQWHSTSTLTRRQMEAAGGFWIATGAPYRSLDTALDVIRHAREHQVPCLGTCQGFQHIMLEFAQAYLGITHPVHAEYDPDAPRPFISELSCSLRGQESEVTLLDGSLASRWYGTSRATERYYCRFGIAPDYVAAVRAGPVRVSGVGSDGEIRIVEYPHHRFMVGTLFVPQARSQPDQPHPLVNAFLRSIAAVQ
ncbi:MAG: gamma-glutamyl-gamma-aminobutyrate hydrolase family protein [Opitutaceae bacterium]